ncbi:hypothetical protein HmCmsJML294_03247 [Escherichia coli]|nr:hypothetical protein HmCmsJML294_03247 [Escherichia coli]
MVISFILLVWLRGLLKSLTYLSQAQVVIYKFPL